MTPPRARVAAGIAILLLAAGLLIVAPRLAPQPVLGTALSDWPAPPEMGDCLNIPERGTVEVVPCGRPHDAEVTRSWAATDPVLDASPSSWSDRSCADAAAGYIGRAAGDSDVPAGPGETRWQPAGLAYQSFQLLAPEAERVGSRGWRACIIRPTMPVRYTGTVRGTAPADLDQSRVPEAYRTCLDDHGNVESCTIPHPTEVLALGTAIVDWQLVIMEPGVEYPRNGSRPGWGWESGTDSQGADLGGADESDTADPDGGADSNAGDSADPTPLDQMAQAQAEAMQRLARERAVLGNQGELLDAEKTLSAQCLDLAPGMVPALTPEPSTPRARLGLSDSTAALDATGPQSGVALMKADDPSPVVLAIDEVNGFESVTAACVVTAPAGQQFSRSLLGWTGDTLPLIPG